MKRLLLLIVIISFTLFGVSFAYMENKVFCTITPDAITVTLDRQNNYKCADYIVVLSQAIHKEYNNVLAIQKLIDQKYDVDFWMGIREAKRAQIKKMLLIKQQLEDSVSKFEINFFEKTKDYIIYKVAPYRIKYNKLLKPLEDLGDNVYLNSAVRKKISLMQEQLAVISQIYLSEDYNTLMDNFSRYIYLKNQIEGK